jgi:hypothetical protein
MSPFGPPGPVNAAVEPERSGILIRVSGYKSAPLPWVANLPRFRFARDAGDSTDLGSMQLGLCGGGSRSLGAAALAR